MSPLPRGPPSAERGRQGQEVENKDLVPGLLIILLCVNNYLEGGENSSQARELEKQKGDERGLGICCVVRGHPGTAEPSLLPVCSHPGWVFHGPQVSLLSLDPTSGSGGKYNI